MERKEQPTDKKQNIALGQKKKEQLRTDKTNESEKNTTFGQWSVIIYSKKVKRLQVFFVSSVAINYYRFFPLDVGLDIPVESQSNNELRHVLTKEN